MSTVPGVRIETLVNEAAARQPTHPAVIFGERAWTYAALQNEMNRRAQRLVEMGIAPGDIILTTEPVTDTVLISFLACCRADCTLLYLSPKLTATELTPLIARANPRAVLTHDGSAHPACPTLPSFSLNLPGSPDTAAREEIVRRAARGTVDAPAIIQATSGTTAGIPKLAILSHRLHTWLRPTPAWWETPGGIYCIPRPYAFAARLFCVVFGLGATMLLSNAADPGQLEDEMEAHGVTSLWTVPSLMQLLTMRDRPLSPALRLEFVRTAAAPLAAHVAQAAARRYGATVVQEYGSMEGGSMIGTPRGGAPAGSIGKPYPGVVVRIVSADGTDVPTGEVGEIIINAPAHMRGYLGDPDATAQALRNGWLSTGDLASSDNEGFIYLYGRDTLRINVGGFKVFPEEIEAVLERHPHIQAVAVTAAMDEARGEIVRAVIVPRGSRPSIHELRGFCQGKLAGYKMPRQWEFREELPRSPLGKVLRHLL